ncbi:MAG: hypothetical protein GY808_01460 [Gammaproteobacteria bacterium]|nr:hypothetical protein [Gammaproteobacteria bacterium]
MKELLLSERQTSAEKIKELEAQNQYLLEQFRLAQQKQFGKSSEENKAQGDLFNQAEQLTDEVVAPEKETVNYTRNKPKNTTEYLTKKWMFS